MLQSYNEVQSYMIATSVAIEPVYTPANADITSEPVAYFGFSEGWLFRAIRAIHSFAELTENWDCEGGKSIAEAARSSAITALLKVARKQVLVPDIYPLNDGGILIEWPRRRGSELLYQIECTPDGMIEISIAKDGQTLYETCIRNSDPALLELALP